MEWKKNGRMGMWVRKKPTAAVSVPAVPSDLVGDRVINVGSYYEEEHLERDLKPLEGKIVQVVSVEGKLEPNEETKLNDASAAARDFNGQSGRCLWWDEEEGKYLVHTFDGVAVGVPEENLEEFDPPEPEEGGFDIVWPEGEAMSYGLFGQMVGDLLTSKGFAVVQMFTNDAIRAAAQKEAKSKPVFSKMRAEFEVAYLGNDNITRCGVMDLDQPGEPAEDALSFCDRDLSNMASLLRPMAKELGFDLLTGRSCALVRTPFLGMDSTTPPPLEDMDIFNRYVENFVTWVVRRKLCLMYVIDTEGGTLQLTPKEFVGMDSVSLPLQKGRMVLFRHDLMDYTYTPTGDSVALQMWLLDAPKTVEFRQMNEVPVAHRYHAVHMMAGAEKFIANCDNTDMSLAMFRAGTDAETYPSHLRFDKDLYLMEGNQDAVYIGKAYHMHGSMVSFKELVSFDNEFFDITEEEAHGMSPAQRWILETGYQALHKGGWSKPELYNQNVGVTLGDSGSEWDNIYYRQDEKTIERNQHAISINRLSYCLGLRGPNINVETACSASLIAANAALHFMRSYTGQKPLDEDDGTGSYHQGFVGELKFAVCMGILVMMGPFMWIGECSALQNTVKGRCFTFDESADGYSRGEGCCACYLQSEYGEHRDVAERSLACIGAMATNQDGRSASLTAPHGPSQTECLRKCLREGYLSPSECYVGECHGTGTALGDPIECGAVRTVMKNMRQGVSPYIHVTAKAHTGHEEANAGTCGLLKIMLMLNSSITTPNPHIRKLNQHLDTVDYPVMFGNEMIQICKFIEEGCGEEGIKTAGGYQVMGVSSFGFGGTNSRAELWAEAERGRWKNGRKTLLTKEEAGEFIQTFLMNVGAGEELPGFLGHGGHKTGH
jgi:polyketide synthase-associated protein